MVRCPTCAVGHLELEGDPFHFHESVESVCCHPLDEREPDWVRYVFTGVMKCNNRRGQTPNLALKSSAYSGRGDT